MGRGGMGRREWVGMGEDGWMGRGSGGDGERG